jgi:hypothetical protein
LNVGKNKAVLVKELERIEREHDAAADEMGAESQKENGRGHRMKKRRLPKSAAASDDEDEEADDRPLAIGRDGLAGCKPKKSFNKTVGGDPSNAPLAEEWIQCSG